MSGVYGPSGRSSGRVASSGTGYKVRRSSGRVSAPEVPPSHAAPTEPSGQRVRRVSRRQLERIHRDLSDRERAILVDLDRFRFLTSGQLQALHFRDHANEDAAARIRRRVLARLADLRVVEHLERRILTFITGGGSALA